jgi:hypothetical protein
MSLRQQAVVREARHGNEWAQPMQIDAVLLSKAITRLILFML